MNYNFCYLDDDVYGAMNEKAVKLSSTDKDAAEKLYMQMQDKILDECYMIFAYDIML